MATLTLSLAAALTACWSATPQPIITTRSLSDAFQVTGVQAFNTGVNSQAATGATASSTGISINFDQAVDRASLERAISVFEGEINNATNPATSTALGLTSMCNGSWRVRNPNASPISFTWDVYKTTQNGAGVVPANTDAFFTSSLGANTVRVFVKGVQQQTKATNPANCTSSALSFAWTADSKSVVASPKTALVLNKAYSVVVSTFAKNSSGSAALSVPYVSKVVVQENLSTSGTLVPGGSFTSRDGVVISAPTGVISTPIQVFAEKVDPVALPVPLPTDFTLVSALFHVGSTKYAESASDDVFSIKIPITSGLVDTNTRVLILTPAYNVDDSPGPEDQLIWFPSGFIDIDITGKSAIVTTSALSPEGVTYALVRYTGTIQSTQVSKEKSVRASLYHPFTFECYLVKRDDCPKNVVEEGLATSENAYSEFVSSFSINTRFEKRTLLKIIMTSCGKDSQNNGGYDNDSLQITICLVARNDGTINTREGEIDYKDVLRHEIFHSFQRIWVKKRPIASMNAKEISKLFLSRKWVIEGTAKAVEKSTINQMNVSATIIPTPRLVTINLQASKDLFNSEYRTQDFWVFAGRKNNVGYVPQKQIFLTGLENPAKDVDLSIEYEGKLKQAYWDWSKNQGYEWNPNFRAEKLPCQIDSKTTYPDFADNRFKTDLSNPLVIANQQVGSLTTRVIPIRFSNPNAQSVKVTLEATTPTATPLKYKIYEGTVPATTTDCTNDPEGTFSNGQTAEILETVTNKTELVIFVANTDFVNPSSFTVKVEAVATAPNIKQQTPNGLQDVIEQPVYLQGVAGQTMTTTLVLTNEGAIGTSMEYTLQPIGNQVTSGVSAASIRNPVSTPTGTAQTDVWNSSLFQTRTGKLRAPSDPNVTNGADKLEIPVNAKCPESGGLMRTNLELVYTTGSVDDFGTPAVFSDDKPELELRTIPITINCISYRIKNGLLHSGNETFVFWNERNQVTYEWDGTCTSTFTDAPGTRIFDAFDDVLMNDFGGTILRRNGNIMEGYHFDHTSDTFTLISDASHFIDYNRELAVDQEGFVWYKNKTWINAPTSMVKFPSVEGVASVSYPAILLRDGTVMTWHLSDIGSLNTSFIPENPNKLAKRTGTSAPKPNAQNLSWPTGLVPSAKSTSLRSSTLYFPAGYEFPAPKPVQGLTNVRRVASGGGKVYALKADGTVWYWNINDDKPALTQLLGLSKIIDLAINTTYYAGETLLALKDDGSVFGFGSDANGEASGDGITKDISYRTQSPVQIPGLSEISSISFGIYGNGYALSKNGNVFVWGFDGIVCSDDGQNETWSGTAPHIAMKINF